jgi:hypothetical protein
MKVKVSDCAHRMTRIVDPERSRLDVLTADKHIDRCVAAVRESLKSPSTHFSAVQQQHLGQIYHSMRWTHSSIRELLRSGTRISCVSMPCRSCGRSLRNCLASV